MPATPGVEACSPVEPEPLPPAKPSSLFVSPVVPIETGRFAAFFAGGGGGGGDVAVEEVEAVGVFGAT